MSAVTDALAEAFMPVSPFSTQAFPSHSARHIHDTNVIQSKSTGVDMNGGDNNGTDKRSFSSAATRIDTPHPARTSLRVSSSSHRDFATPSNLPESGRESGNIIYHTPNDSLQPEFTPVTQAGDQSVDPNILARLGNPLEGSLTTPSASGLTSGSTTGVDLLLGPQSLPFVLRRRYENTKEDLSPLKAAVPIFTPRSLNAPSSAISIKPAPDQNRTPVPSAIEVVTATAKQVVDHFCSWRKEQLHHLKPAAIRSGTTARPIPTLYGPLSLPYARNPSGVDATIADETAYLSHVFGLRPAPDVPLPGVAHTIRSVSSGTQASRSTSGSHTTRSTSGSSDSFQLSHTNTSTNSSVLTDGSSYTTAGGTHHFRPMVVRDPNQQIGIRKKPSTIKSKDAQAVIEVKGRPLRSSNLMSSENKENNPSVVVFGAAVQDDIAAAEEATKLRHANVFVRPRAHSSGALPVLTPIPGSPIDLTTADDPFGTLCNQTIDAAEGRAGVARPRSASTSATERGSVPHVVDHTTSSVAGSVCIPAGFMPVLWNPDTSTYEVVIPSSHHFQGDTATAVLRSPPPIPQPGRVPHITPIHPSKADSSSNWRPKKETSQVEYQDKDKTAVVSTLAHAEAPSTTIDADKKGDSLNTITSNDDKVMTVGKLFEKFSHSSPKGSDVAAAIVSSTPVATNALVNASRKPSKSTPVSPRRIPVTVLGETSQHSNTNVAAQSVSDTEQQVQTKTIPHSPRSAPSPARRMVNSVPAAKGTPGAGKLLKRTSAASTDENAPAVPVKTGSAGSKGKSRAGKK